MQSSDRKRNTEEAATACGAGHTPECLMAELSRAAYKLLTVTKMIDAPEQTRELSHWVFRRSRPLFRDDGDRRSGVKPTDEPLMATDWL